MIRELIVFFFLFFFLNWKKTKNFLGLRESNPGHRNDNPTCYHYTKADYKSIKIMKCLTYFSKKERLLEFESISKFFQILQMSIDADELNFLIRRHLEEAGYHHTAYVFGTEAMLEESKSPVLILCINRL